MFGNKHTYCKVKFDDEKTYWYRTNDYGFRAGMKVIVPVTDNGLWKIGTIAEAAVYRVQEVPFPLVQTKGIVGKAGLFAESKIRSHNALIERSPYPPIDISKCRLETGGGTVIYCTCARERELFKNSVKAKNLPYVLIENYPVSKESDIPRQAKEEMLKKIKKIQERQKKLRELKFETEAEFEEVMEDLDEYN